jgi:transcriptional regulator with XRE-family HTH domain
MARPKRTPLTPRLLEHRHRLGLTQEQVAERVGITPEMVRRHEHGLATPIAMYQARYCKLYNADEVALGFRVSDTKSVVSHPPAEFEDVLDIMKRVQQLERTSIGSAALDALALSLDDYVDRYEREGPKPLMGPLIKQRSLVEELIGTASHHSERRRLYEIAGRTSALLAYMCVNRGRYPLARAYCKEAFMLGDLADNPEIQAWVRGTQSFCEYYAGDFTAAANLAVDGLQYAGDGPQAVRLLINGQARALAKLGDLVGVHAAVQRTRACPADLESWMR